MRTYQNDTFSNKMKVMRSKEKENMRVREEEKARQWLNSYDKVSKWMGKVTEGDFEGRVRENGGLVVVREFMPEFVARFASKVGFIDFFWIVYFIMFQVNLLFFSFILLSKHLPSLLLFHFIPLRSSPPSPTGRPTKPITTEATTSIITFTVPNMAPKI